MQIVIQIDGKLRDRFTVPRGPRKNRLPLRARETDRIRSLVGGRAVSKGIEVPDGLVSFVAF